MVDDKAGLDVLVKTIITNTKKSLADGAITKEDAVTGLKVILSDMEKRGAPDTLLKELTIFMQSII